MSYWMKKAAIPSRVRTTVNVFAPAKINLTLHVTGQRKDGYHLLDSLVVFAPVGDSLTIGKAKKLELTVDGPERLDVPENAENLVLRVARLLSPDGGASITLTKNLPVASGIGGGSADAAAALRGLMQLWGMPNASSKSPEDLGPLAAQLLGLGADIPMCLMSQPARIGGIGELITPVAGLPPLPALLVNPRTSVSTPEVFRELRPRINPPMPESLPAFRTLVDFVGWLAEQRNDLQQTAIRLQPAIADVLKCLERSDRILLSRMSGSGATCFGIFPDKASAIVAGEFIRRDHPGWWVATGMLGDQKKKSLPVVS